MWTEIKSLANTSSASFKDAPRGLAERHRSLTDVKQCEYSTNICKLGQARQFALAEVTRRCM